MPRKPDLYIVATGGTIAMRFDPVTGGATPAVTGADLVATVPGLGALAQVSVEEFANIPSEHMRPDIWLQLARRLHALINSQDAPAGIVILHGTDTMEETAFFLDVTVPSDIPIVLTGAQRTVSDPNPDGPGNILDAATVALHPKARGRGVLIVMHGEIHAARSATKAETEDVDAFDSTAPPDQGWVRNGRVRFTGSPLSWVHVPLPASAPRVDIVPMYAGADDAALSAALERGAAGLVIEAVGAGNVNQNLFQGIIAALHREIPVVISSRVLRGGVRPIYAYAGGGITLRDAGAILAQDLSPQKARALLIAGIGAGLSQADLSALFETPFPGHPATDEKMHASGLSS